MAHQYIEIGSTRIMSWDIHKIRQDFPILQKPVNGVPLTYLDSAATAQKPQCVVDAVAGYYRKLNANVHRSAHLLSEKATEAFEQSRQTVANFIGAKSTKEIIFTRGTTESINLIANTFGQQLKPGDEIIISAMEHHANIVPWQLLKQRTGIEIKVIPMSYEGELDLATYASLFNERTRLACVVHTSNVLGTVNPVKYMTEIAHQHHVPILIDGAQSIVHQTIDVQDLNCDFFVFSGHKLYGPTGIGVLYGKQQLLEQMPPFLGGGEMIQTVSFEQSTYAPLPYKFEAGTPNIAGVIGLKSAIDYIQALGIQNIATYEQELKVCAEQALSEIPGLEILGQAQNKAPVISFVLEDIHPHDIASIVDHNGVAVRAGHHCAMPVMGFYDVPATTRASFAFYNTQQEIDTLVNALNQARKLFN